MATLDSTERAKIQLAAGDTIRISTTGQCTVQGLSGAPSSTTTLTSSSQDFGPYGVAAVLLLQNVSGRTDYSLNNATYPLNSTEKRNFDSLVSDAGVGLLVGDQIQAATTNLAAAVGSAGSLTGTYYYTFTFVTERGETAPWPGTASSVTPAGQRVNLSNIQTGPAGTIARRLYRTIAGPVDPKDYRFLAEIGDNTTTTYTDDAADGTLGDPVSWAATNRGVIAEGATKVGRMSDQATAFGFEAMAGNVGYACTAIGYQALYSVTSGRRNTAMGVYALPNLTTAYECTAIGVHAGQQITTGVDNTLVGYSAGRGLSTSQSNTAIGYQAMYGASSGTAGAGDYNTALGARALGDVAAGVRRCLGVGYAAGKYANADYQIFIDTLDRANLANEQDVGLIYGQVGATAPVQQLRFNAVVRLGWGAATVSQLPAASATYKGYRGHVTDASVAYTSANVGSTVAGGGSNTVPVFCNGTNWVIG